MALSDGEQLEILVRRLLKFKYSMDEKERSHLLSLIKRGVIIVKKEPTDGLG